MFKMFQQDESEWENLWRMRKGIKEILFDIMFLFQEQYYVMMWIIIMIINININTYKNLYQQNVVVRWLWSKKSVDSLGS